LTSHEAAREDVDSLKNPDASAEKEQDAQDVQYDPHSVTAEVGDFVVIVRKTRAYFAGGFSRIFSHVVPSRTTPSKETSLP
jgi:hypothetical protein